MKNKIAKSGKQQNITSSISKTPKSILLFIFKGIIFFGIIIAAITYSEHKGFFKSDDTNNHTLRKWDSFYELTGKHNIDIILIGNSHLYTGINPKNLSEALGVNAFILAAPGTNIADSYFCLQEALTKCKPQVVVVETYGINHFILNDMNEESVSSQIKSFAARRNLYLKSLSTHLLFNCDTWAYAWSNTIRNHHFIFTNQEQIKTNMKPVPKQAQKLYLGRYVRWTSGIEDSTLLKYKQKGAPVDGNKFTLSQDAEIYTKKIADLCKKHQIKLIFLTLPMYSEHVTNYDSWKSSLEKVLAQYSCPWLDFQQLYDPTLLTPECFEDTYAINQHLTYHGSLVCSYKLAEYIEQNLGTTLKRQDSKTKWHNLFYGDEGYFENYSPRPDDTNNIILLKNTTLNNIPIKEIDLIKHKEYQTILLKIENSSFDTIDLHRAQLRMVVRIKQGEQYFVTEIITSYDLAHMTLKHHLFQVNLRPDIDIIEVLNVSF